MSFSRRVVHTSVMSIENFQATHEIVELGNQVTKSGSLIVNSQPIFFYHTFL